MNEIITEKLKEVKLYNETPYMILLDFIDFDTLLDEMISKFMFGTNKTDRYSQIIIKMSSVLRDYVVIVEDVLYKKPTVEGFTKLFVVNETEFTNFFSVIFESLVAELDMEKVCRTIINRLTKTMSNNFIIQFNDCYIENCQIYEGFYSQSIPAYTINRNIFNAAQGTFTKIIPEVDDFLLHLSDNQPDTKERFLESLSICLINDPNVRQYVGEFIRLFGPTAENGKSTMLNLLRKTFGEHNIEEFSTSQLKGYSLETTSRALIAMDSDSSADYIKEESAANIKKIVTSDPIQVRQIYSKPITVIPIVTLIAASNALPKSEDKTNGLARRMVWYKISGKLIRSDSWFDIIKSEEAAQYLMELIIQKYVEIVLRDPIQTSELTPDMIKMKKSFEQNNNNIIEFMEEQNISEDVNQNQVARVRKEYEKWCEMNDETPFGSTKFNQVVEGQFSLKRQAILAKHIKNLDDVGGMVNPNKRIKCWIDTNIYKDNLKN